MVPNSVNTWSLEVNIFNYFKIIWLLFTSIFLFKKNYFIYLFIFGCAGSPSLHRLSLVVASRGCSLVVVDGLLISAASLAERGLSGTRTSVVAARGLSTCGSQTRTQAQWPWPRGSAALWHVGSSWIRDPAQVPCVGRRILYHWAAREAPTSVFLPKTYMLLFLDFSVLAIICCPSYSHSHARTHVFLLPLWHQSNYINVLKYFVLNMF